MIRYLVVAFTVVLAGCAQDTPTVEQPAQQEQPAGPQEVAVTAVEYEFQGIPETLVPGEVTLTFVNAGKEPHELGMVRILTDTSIEELIELPEKKSRAQIEEAGHAFAKPGKSAQETITLEAGRYGYACFVEAKDGTPHAFLGMRGEFTVA